MISKELLSEVLGIDALEVVGISPFERNKIQYKDAECDSNSWKTTSNIYELYNKCKEWAYSQGYKVIEVEKGVVWVVPNRYNILLSFNYSMIAYQDEDIESACQWILDNKC